MKHLNELNRNRLLKLYNLLPEDLAKKELPAFYVPASFLYVDWDSINLDKYDHLFKPKSPTNKKSKLQTAIKKTVNIAGVKNLLNSKRLHNKNSKGQTFITSLNKEKSEYEKYHVQARPIKFVPYSINSSALYDKGCLTCGKDNIEVRYYKERHICLRCRNYLKTYYNDKAVIFLNDKEEIEILGEKIGEDGTINYYPVEFDQIWFNEYRCYATLADVDELIILLHDDQSVKKKPKEGTQEKKFVKF